MSNHTHEQRATLAGLAGAWPRRIGIVGGLGPYAHIEFERRLLRAVEERLDRPARDQDYPEWIVSCQPQIPDRTTALLSDGPSPVPALVAALRLLDRTDFAVIACNTAHACLPQVRQCVPTPILDVVQETTGQIVSRFGEGAVVGLLATSGALASGVYARSASALSGRLRVLSPFDLGLDGDRARHLQEHSVMGAIRGRPTGVDDLRGGIKSGALDTPAIRERIVAELSGVIRLFRDAGACAVILGCTELSIVADLMPDPDLPLLDPLQIAARAAIAIAAGERPLPCSPARCGPCST
jgi:aspartate racemase